MYKLLCKLGLHIKYLTEHEQSTTNSDEYRWLNRCECGKSKEYPFGDAWFDDNTAYFRAVNK